MIRFIVIFLLAFPLFAGQIDLRFSTEQLSSGQWNLTYGQGKTSMMMLPMDVNFTDIQNSLDANDVLYVYTNEQTPQLLEVKFGIYFVGLVKITKSKIIYAVIDSAGTHPYNTFGELNNYLTNTIGSQISDSVKKELFINSYIPYLEKIKANGLYKVMPQGQDFTFNVVLPMESNVSTGATSGSGVETPPQVPQL